MNRWLVGLGVAAIVLPLIIFVGNLKIEVGEGPEGEVEGSLESASTPEAAEQGENAQAAALSTAAATGATAIAKVNKPAEASPKAAELVGISDWINSEPLKLADLKGKVVLVDFWTYTCINCVRTLPYLTMWHDKYADKGLVIIGVHSPEFDFEKDLENVNKAVAKHSIKYPVALDNDHSTWRAFRNNYWPHKYLIDIDGRVRYDHIGEGGYDRTERAIQELLKERAEKIGEKVAIPEGMSLPKDAVGIDFASIATPEIYFGYEFARVNLGNEQGFVPGEVVTYAAPDSYASLTPNVAFVEGEWRNNPEALELVSDEGRILLKYTAKAVNVVAGQGVIPAVVYVSLDGKPANSTNKGSDVEIARTEAGGAVAVIDEQRLYNVVNDNSYSTRVLELAVTGKGFRIYTFTFG
ncbi:thioredoxin family protein [Candidatus Woesearchaeota archaeon]|nr:thioredoxin family protein [Candidatus Woesearchaeota archaeon]